MTARELAAFLHASVCQSMDWSEDCQRPDGGSHGAQRLTDAKRILAAADPDEALHDELCEAYIHGTAHPNVGIRCRDRLLHIEAFRKADLLGLRPVADQPDLFGVAS